LKKGGGEIDFQALSLIFAKVLHQVETSKKNTTFWWLLFLGSTALQVYAIYDHWEYLTLILPFVCTSFVKALDII
jgi:hypothetical protein